MKTKRNFIFINREIIYYYCKCHCTTKNSVELTINNLKMKINICNDKILIKKVIKIIICVQNILKNIIDYIITKYCNTFRYINKEINSK